MPKLSSKFAYLISFATGLIYYQIASAANLSNAFSIANESANNTYQTNRELYPILGDIISVILSIIGIIFTIFIIYAGYLWLTAAGNETKVDKAKDILKQSLIGIAVVIGAYVISYFFIQIISPQLNNH